MLAVTQTPIRAARDIRAVAIISIALKNTKGAEKSK